MNKNQDKSQTLQEKLAKVYSRRFKSIEKRINHAPEDVKVDLENLSLDEMKALAQTFIEEETHTLKEDVEKLLEQKEAIE